MTDKQLPSPFEEPQPDQDSRGGHSVVLDVVTICILTCVVFTLARLWSIMPEDGAAIAACLLFAFLLALPTLRGRQTAGHVVFRLYLLMKLAALSRYL